MARGETLAYLAGLIDGDGYLKIVKSMSRGRTNYRIQVGIQQLWPGPAVQLFAQTFASAKERFTWPGHRPIARCELHGRRAAAALLELSPHLLVKKRQARLLLELQTLKAQPKESRSLYSFVNRWGGQTAIRTPSFSVDQLAKMDCLRTIVLALHTGTAKGDSSCDCDASQKDADVVWTREYTFAYLAGIMDSDGNFRIEKKSVPGMLSPHYRLNIRASQVAPSPAIELLAETFGGRVAMRRTRRPNHRDLDTWSLHDGRAAAAINELLPYLVVKKREAELLLELLRLKAEGKKGLTEWVHPNRWRPVVIMRKRCYTPEQVSEFERIHREVQGLHSGESNARPLEGTPLDTVP